ncbi:hypothetical protein HYU11_04415 [Candidatus Woesearchaeota archaeon]|nr:hypothetical protein [Candidatus Woesearchaeota archaeon]
MADKKKEPTALETFKAKRKAIDQLIHTIELHHHDAYITAAKKHLSDGNVIDYSRLEDTAIQDKFAQEMTDFYVEKAKTYFGISPDKALDDQQIEMLLLAYAGITKSNLFELTRRYGEDFTLRAYRGQIDQVQEAIAKRMLPLAETHIKDEHKAGIIKEMSLEDKIDASKITTPQLAGLMHEYHGKGAVDARSYKREIYKKPAPKDKAA